MIIPENGGAPVYEGLRLARPRPGVPDLSPGRSSPPVLLCDVLDRGTAQACVVPGELDVALEKQRDDHAQTAPVEY